MRVCVCVCVCVYSVSDENGVLSYLHNNASVYIHAHVRFVKTVCEIKTQSHCKWYKPNLCMRVCVCVCVCVCVFVCVYLCVYLCVSDDDGAQAMYITIQVCTFIHIHVRFVKTV